MRLIFTLLLPVLHQRHHSLYGPVPQLHRWLPNVLMISQVLQATVAKLSRADVLLLHLLDIFRLCLCSQLICPLFSDFSSSLLLRSRLRITRCLNSLLKVVSQASLSSEEGPRLLLLVLEALHLLCLLLPPPSTLLHGGWLHICELLAHLDSVFASGLDVEVRHHVDQRLRRRRLARLTALVRHEALELGSFVLTREESPPARKGLSPAVGATLRSAVGSSRSRPGGWVHTSDTALSDWAANSAVSSGRSSGTLCRFARPFPVSLSCSHASSPRLCWLGTPLLSYWRG